MQPTTKAITKVLDELEAAERDPLHPRSLAKAAVKRWKSDAAKYKHPITNITTDSGAPLLVTDEVLARDDAAHEARLGRK